MIAAWDHVREYVVGVGASKDEVRQSAEQYCNGKAYWPWHYSLWEINEEVSIGWKDPSHTFEDLKARGKCISRGQYINQKYEIMPQNRGFGFGRRRYG